MNFYLKKSLLSIGISTTLFCLVLFFINIDSSDGFLLLMVTMLLIVSIMRWTGLTKIGWNNWLKSMYNGFVLALAIVFVWYVLATAIGYGYWLGIRSTDLIEYLLLYFVLSLFNIVVFGNYLSNMYNEVVGRTRSLMLGGVWCSFFMMSFGGIGWLGFVNSVFYWWFVFLFGSRFGWMASLGMSTGIFFGRWFLNFLIVKADLLDIGISGIGLVEVLYWLFLIWCIYKVKRNIFKKGGYVKRSN